jgi:hypothetical protein
MPRRLYRIVGGVRGQAATFRTRSGLMHWCALSSAALVLAGCSSKKVEGRKPVFPVRGKVLVGGQPAPGALVVFHPVGVSFDAERPFAHVGPDGTFDLTTYQGKDGAPEGEYAVTLQWYVSTDRNAPGPWPNVLPTRYARPDLTDVRVRVAQQPNELQPFNIAR